MWDSSLGRQIAHWGSWVILALGCGVLSALAGGILMSGVHGFYQVLTGWLQPALAPLVGILVFLVMLRVSGLPLRGPGTDEYILAVHGKNSPLQAGPALTRLLATVGVVGSGGSGGLAGPALFIGAGLAQTLSRFASGREETHRHLQLMGAASMLAVVLNAPVAAAILAAEILYRQSIRFRICLSPWGAWEDE